jgi:hypothetical protein
MRAEGSIKECRYYFMRAKDLGYPEASSVLEEVSRMLNA